MSRTGDPRSAAAEKRYFAAIEDEFRRRRGHPLLLSPRDWQRIADWWGRGIPCAVVLEAIDIAFRRRNGVASGAAIRTLGYCEPILLDLWERRRHREVGGRRAPGAAGPPEVDDLGRQLQRIRLRLREADRSDRPAGLRRALRACLERIDRERQFEPDQPPPAERLERCLQDLERQLAAAARNALPAGDRTRIEAEVDRALGPYRETMNDEIFAETRRILCEDRYRRRLSLPRLSLYDLS